ncbi:DUF4352 domain-containing protein [Microbispora sp. NPDC049125]|uniref:DUF4352 domain-containing protein n=1 Tax=Microbispora sp. NPDC049125 TaxID=3154929 RepID=UPI00346603BB
MAVTHPQASVTTPATRQRPPARRGALRRIAAGVAGLGLAAAAVYAQTFAPSFEELGAFLTYKGGIGRPVETGRFTVKVTSVGAARAVDTTDFSNKVSKVGTSNVFLLVNMVATTPREPMQLAALTPPVLMSGDGRRYKPTDKVAESLTMFNKWIQPGLWSSGVLVFEVPKDAVRGARFVFRPPTGAIPVDSFAPEVEIDLGLSGAAGDRLVSQAEAFHSLVPKTS